MRSCARRRRISPRRSSTADRSDGRVHRRPSRRPTGSSRSAGCCRSPRRRTTSTRPAGPIPAKALGPGATRCELCAEIRRVWRGELRRLRRPEGLAAAPPRGHRRGPLHGRAADAADGPAGRRPRQGDPGRRSRTGDAVPGRPGEPAVPGAAAERSCGWRTSPMSRPGRVSCTWPSSSTSSRGGSSAGGCRARCAAASSLDALEQALHARQARAGGLDPPQRPRRCNTSRSATPSGWPRPASSRRSAASATPTTTRWPRRSSACSRPRSSSAADRGVARSRRVRDAGLG